MELDEPAVSYINLFYLRNDIDVDMSYYLPLNLGHLGRFPKYVIR